MNKETRNKEDVNPKYLAEPMQTLCSRGTPTRNETMPVESVRGEGGEVNWCG